MWIHEPGGNPGRAPGVVMGDGVDIGIRSEDLDRGAAEAAGAAAAADAAVGRLGGAVLEPAVLEPAVFGQVGQAGPLAAATAALVGAATEIGRAVSRRHADLAERARSTAGTGAELVATTTAVAARATPAATPPGR